MRGSNKYIDVVGYMYIVGVVSALSLCPSLQGTVV